MSDATADAALAALPVGDGPVEVLGDGALAAALRERLAARISHGSDAAGAAIDTTGDAAVIAAALARLADLGTLVLAAACEPAPLDLYTDVHVRGLTIVGVPATAGDRAGGG